MGEGEMTVIELSNDKKIIIFLKGNQYAATSINQLKEAIGEKNVICIYEDMDIMVLEDEDEV